MNLKSRATGNYCADRKAVVDNGVKEIDIPAGVSDGIVDAS